MLTSEPVALGSFIIAFAIYSLTGRKPDDVVEAMQAFKSGQRPSTVMDRLAKGFSDDEIKAIAAWYGTQKD